MKMNSQSRSFVKQVQVDLLALSDADLFQTVHQWVDGRNASEFSFAVSEDTRVALGYTPMLVETEALSHLPHERVETSSERAISTQWLAPLPHHLRAILTAMDANLFAQHVITIAFQSLHTIHPEWYDGVTFNAHLANYLRQMRDDKHTTTKRRA